MKFSCITSHLTRAAGIAERFCGKNISLPALSHVLVEASDGVVVVTGTNLEHAVEWRVPARVARKGRVCLPAKVLSSILQSFGDEKVEAEDERGNLRLKTSSRDGRVNGMSPDDFPLVPKIKKTAAFSVDAGVVSAAIARVLPAVSRSEFKPELSGIMMRAAGDTLTMAATDTFRLAESVVSLKRSVAGDDIACIVPERTAQEITRTFDQDAGVVEIAVGENQLLAETADGRIVSRLIEGSFPDYRAIIPTGFTTSAYIKKNELIAAIRSASIFASKLQEATVRFSAQGLEVVSANPDIGDYRVTVPAAFEGNEVAISFNWRYLLDGVQSLEDEDVFFGCTRESSPALLRNKSHQRFSYVVMPIRAT
jgi:DNA polymerase-3 subunit beta